MVRGVQNGSSEARPGEAVILFADLMNSSQLSNLSKLDDYDSFMCDFQRAAGEIVHEWYQELSQRIAREGPDPEHPLQIEAELRGDELCVKLFRQGEHIPDRLLTDDVSQALLLAIRIKRKWLLHERNAQRIERNQPVLDVGIGINQGSVMVGPHGRFDGRVHRPGTNGDVSLALEMHDVIEGFSINLAKRIEAHSRELRYSQILVSHSVYSLVNKDWRVALRRVEVSSMKGFGHNIAVYEAIGIGHFDDAQFEAKLADTDKDTFKKAVERNPDMIWLLLDLGHYHFDREEYIESGQCYQKVVSLIRDFAPAHLYLGRCYYRRGMYEESRQALERALSYDPLSSRTNRFLAVCYRRLAYKYSRTGGQEQQAGELYRRAFELHELALRQAPSESPEKLWALTGLAHTIAEADQRFRVSYSIEKAIEYAKEAQELLQMNGLKAYTEKAHLVLDTLGFAYVKQANKNSNNPEGEHSEAEAGECLSQALEILEMRRHGGDQQGGGGRVGSRNYHEKYSEIRYHQALLEQQRRHFNEAVKHAVAAIETFCDAPEGGDKIGRVEDQYWYEEADRIANPPGSHRGK